MKFAYIFPGQGTQFVGMGHDLYEHFSLAKDFFHRANEILKFDIMRLCFFGPIEELTETKNCQPAVFLTSVITLRCLEDYLRSRLKDRAQELLSPSACGGLSLGEYSALVAAGSISFEDGLILVRRRGEFMEEAALANKGTMSAVVGIERDELEKIAAESGAEIANINSPNQIVIAGSIDAVEKAEKIALQKGAKKAIRLNVAGAFHSSLMDSAAKKLMVYFKDTPVLKPNFTVLSNVSAYYSFLPHEIKANLINQVNHTTLWLDCVRIMIDLGITRFLEIGPGKTLKGILRKIDPNLIVHNLETFADIDLFYNEVVSEEE